MNDTPIEKLRKKVRALAGFGMKQKQICTIIGIRSTKTLRKRFSRELSGGIVEARAKVLQAVFKAAISGRSPKMTIFYLKTHGPWSTRRDPESERCKEVFDIVPFDPEVDLPKSLNTGRRPGGHWQSG